ncbi:MAG TPA: hypothetical protein DCO72_09335 [Ruminococcus sp.]|nr:hypothetical protein [Ruminococcus sp.]
MELFMYMPLGIGVFMGSFALEYYFVREMGHLDTIQGMIFFLLPVVLGFAYGYLSVRLISRLQKISPEKAKSYAKVIDGIFFTMCYTLLLLHGSK